MVQENLDHENNEKEIRILIMTGCKWTAQPMFNWPLTEGIGHSPK